jgi:ABC-2 type transport system ATP-binding protein
VPGLPLRRNLIGMGENPDMDAKIQLENLSVSFGRRPILKNLTCSLSGRSVGLLGPNGAGKTTLINTLLGFFSPRDKKVAIQGIARVFGNNIRSDGKSFRSKVGYMPESDAFISGMTAIRFVRMMAELSGLPSREALDRAHEALTYVGLGEARYRELGTYSTGMKQLVKLAQAIVHGPELLFLDEPTNGLDPPARQRMLRLVREIRDSGETCVILSSHLLRDVEDSCEQVLILKEGNLAAYCNLEEEWRANRRFLELELNGELEPFVSAMEEKGCVCAPYGQRKLKLILPDQLEVQDLYREAAARQIQIQQLHRKRDSLEEIFLKAMEDSHASV